MYLPSNQKKNTNHTVSHLHQTRSSRFALAPIACFRIVFESNRTTFSFIERFRYSIGSGDILSEKTRETIIETRRILGIGRRIFVVSTRFREFSTNVEDFIATMYTSAASFLQVYKCLI